MDKYLNNMLWECDAPDFYKVQVEGEYSQEDVLFQSLRLMVFDTGYQLSITGCIKYTDFTEDLALRIYRENEQILRFKKIGSVTQEKAEIYRIFCFFEDAEISEELKANDADEKASVDRRVIQTESHSIGEDEIEALYEKYFSEKNERSLLLERRRMRRRQSVSEDNVKGIMSDLNGLIGLEAVKMEVEKMFALEAQKEFLSSVGIKSMPNDMLFLGNPGTGKTTVARYLTEILYKMGKIRENKCVEINGHSLIGGYIGQTASTVERYLHEARGGVLFIDEAYSLLDGSESFASDAITKLLGALTKPNRDFVCFFAGYEEEMNELMRFNAGFESRVATKLHFENYTLMELGEIFCRLIKTYGYSVEKEALTDIIKYFETVIDSPKFSNGRFVRNLFEKLEEEHCKYFDGTEEEADVFCSKDLTDEIKHELAMGIV